MTTGRWKFDLEMYVICLSDADLSAEGKLETEPLDGTM